MKKQYKIYLTVPVLCLLLSCCGRKNQENAAVPSIPPRKPTVADTTEPPTVETTGTSEITLDEKLLYDEGGIKITVKGLEETWMGQDIKLMVENNTDRNIALSGDNVVVNGVTMNGYLYIDVAAGKKANGVLTLHADSLDTAGIEQIAWMQTCDARIVDTDSFETIANVALAVETSLGRDYVQQLDETGEMLYEENDTQVIAKMITDEFYGRTLMLYVKNTGQKDITIQAENISVNGFTVDAWLYDLVCAGTSRFCDLDLWESGLEENEIQSIEDISFSIRLIDPKSLDTLAESGELQVVIGK